MKIVISASRRTDIPAFYMDWFIRAIHSGKIQIQNPVYKKHKYEVDLRPRNVEWIVFWSRNFKRFLIRRENFSEYNLFFQFTIVSHHPGLEKTHLPVEQAISQMEKLAHYYGPDRIIWRYDPVVVWEEGGAVLSNYDANEFVLLCSRLSAINIGKCYFSLVSPYQKFKKRFTARFPEGKLVDSRAPASLRIFAEIREQASRFGISLYSCCNDTLLDDQIRKGHCISGELLNQLLREPVVSMAKAPTRKDCGCTRSVDIGNYVRQPCYFGCIYCYANPVI